MDKGENNMKKIMIKDFSFNYRMPREFYGLGNNRLKAFLVWIAHCWNKNMCDVWQDIGY